jgi:hypothetical protein
MQQSFVTKIRRDSKKNVIGIVVPPEVVSALGKSKKPSKKITLNGYLSDSRGSSGPSCRAPDRRPASGCRRGNAWKTDWIRLRLAIGHCSNRHRVFRGYGRILRSHARKAHLGFARHRSCGCPTYHESLIREAFTVVGAIPFVGPVLALGAWISIVWTVRSSALRRGKHDILAGGTRVVRHGIVA